MKQEGNIIKDAKHRMYIQHIDLILLNKRVLFGLLRNDE